MKKGGYYLMKENKKKEKQPRSINPYALLFAVIVLCGILSFIIAPGSYVRNEIDGRTVIDPASYHVTERTPVSFVDFFKAVPEGLIGSGNVVFLILIVGGTVEILNRSGALGVGISYLVDKTSDKGNLIIWIFMLIFSILGGFMGWVEAAIPFVPIVIPIIISLGYDAMTAGAVVIIGLLVAFATGPTNMYTVGIAHEIAELPVFSGIGFRTVVFVVFVLIGMVYVNRYASRVKKNPELSLTKDVDVSDLRMDLNEFLGKKPTTPQTISLVALGIAFLVVIYGMLSLGWGLNDMTAIFLLLGIIVGIINGMGVNGTVDSLLTGIKGSVNGAMIVGIARGVQWILEQGGAIDPIIHGLSNIIQGWPSFASAIGMVVIVSLLNGLVPSGSGKAMALMPLIIPLADIVGVTRQTTVLAYQLGDGITNMFWFTYGTLLMFLNWAKIPLKQWYKFVLPLMVILSIVGAAALFIAIQINYN